MGRFKLKHTRVENVAVIAGGRHLREVEEQVEITEYDYIGVNEYDLLVFSKLPQPKLAIIVLVIGILLRPRVPNPFDDPEGPPGPS